MTHLKTVGLITDEEQQHFKSIPFSKKNLRRVGVRDGVVKRRSQTAQSNYTVKQHSQTAQTNSTVKQHSQTAQSNGDIIHMMRFSIFRLHTKLQPNLLKNVKVMHVFHF